MVFKSHLVGGKPSQKMETEFRKRGVEVVEDPGETGRVKLYSSMVDPSKSPERAVDEVMAHPLFDGKVFIEQLEHATRVFGPNTKARAMGKFLNSTLVAYGFSNQPIVDGRKLNVSVACKTQTEWERFCYALAKQLKVTNIIMGYIMFIVDDTPGVYHIRIYTI